MKEYTPMHNTVQVKTVFTSSEKPIHAFLHLSEDSPTGGGTIPDILPETVPVLMPHYIRERGENWSALGKPLDKSNSLKHYTTKNSQITQVSTAAHRSSDEGER